MGLEHHRPAAVAARLEVDHQPDVGPGGVGGEEGLGAEHARLLAVCEQHHHIPLARRGRQRPDRFQDGGDARRVVGAARAGGDGVVMGHQQQRRGLTVAPRQHAQQVAALALAAGEGPGLRLEAELGHPLQEIGLDPGGVGRADRMGTLGDGAHVGHGATGGEHSRRRIDGGRRRGAHGEDGGEEPEEQQEQGRRPAHHRPSAAVRVCRARRRAGRAVRRGAGGGRRARAGRAAAAERWGRGAPDR